jgi:hypothetical protein
MERNREQTMAKARARRRRREKVRSERKALATHGPRHVADQLKAATVTAVEKVGSLLNSAAQVVKAAVSAAPTEPREGSAHKHPGPEASAAL